MSQTPSNRRREGRHAFFEGGNPAEHCRYKTQSYRDDFFDGWEEARRKHAQNVLSDPPRDTLLLLKIDAAQRGLPMFEVIVVLLLVLILLAVMTTI